MQSDEYLLLDMLSTRCYDLHTAQRLDSFRILHPSWKKLNEDQSRNLECDKMLPRN